MTVLVRLQQGAAKGFLDWLPGRVVLTVVTTGLVEFVGGLGLEVVGPKAGQKPTPRRRINAGDTTQRQRAN